MTRTDIVVSTAVTTTAAVETHGTSQALVIRSGHTTFTLVCPDLPALDDLLQRITRAVAGAMADVAAARARRLTGEPESATADEMPAGAETSDDPPAWRPSGRRAMSHLAFTFDVLHHGTAGTLAHHVYVELEALLASWGCEVMGGSTGAEAIHEAEEPAPPAGDGTDQ